MYHITLVLQYIVSARSGLHTASNQLYYINTAPNAHHNLHDQVCKQCPYLVSKDETFLILEELVTCSFFGTRSEYFGFSCSHSCNYNTMSILQHILMEETKHETCTIHYPQSMACLILVALIGITDSKSH